MRKKMSYTEKRIRKMKQTIILARVALAVSLLSVLVELYQLATIL